MTRKITDLEGRLDAALKRAREKRIPTSKKPLKFCVPHLKQQLASDRDGGGWTDMKPLCPDCEWKDGYDEGFADAVMAAKRGRPR